MFCSRVQHIASVWIHYLQITKGRPYHCPTCSPQMLYLEVPSVVLCPEVDPRNLKGGIGSLFDPCVNTMGQRPYWLSRTEVSYCTSGFGGIIWSNLRTLSLPRDSPCNNLSPCRKGNSRFTKVLGRLSYEKTRRYNNSPPYVMAGWPPQQIPPCNVLGWTRSTWT